MSDVGKPESSENRLRVLLADDHPLLLERVTVLLQSTFEVVGVAHNGLEMVDKAMRLSPDIIVADNIDAEVRRNSSGPSASGNGGQGSYRFSDDP